MIETPHIKCNKEDVSDFVLMPGDPLRAKYIAETYLKDYKLINSVRNMLGYTGFYKNRKITIFSSGMGMPSMGIYCYELYKFFDVKYIIRIGTAGSFNDDIDILDIVLSTSSYTEGNFAYNFNNIKCNEKKSSDLLNKRIMKKAEDLNMKIKIGRTFCGECFDPYLDNGNVLLERLPKDIVAAEMEAFSLFYVADYLNKEASCLMTISDNIKKKKNITSEQRQTSLDEMIKLALETSLEVK